MNHFRQNIFRDSWREKKKNVSLKIFLIIDAFFVEIVSINRYFAILNFVIIFEDDATNLRQNSKFNVVNISSFMIQTNFLMNDVIQHCYRLNIFDDNVVNAKYFNVQKIMIMIIIAQQSAEFADAIRFTKNCFNSVIWWIIVIVNLMRTQSWQNNMKKM